MVNKSASTIDPERSPAGGSLKGHCLGLIMRVGRVLDSPSLLLAIPLVIGFTVPLWIGLQPSLLFGQDASSLVLPFAFSKNPLVQYNYLFLWSFPVPDETPYFVFSLFVQMLEDLIPSIIVVQWIAIGALVATAGFGVLYLLHALSRALGAEARTIRFWQALLCVSLYIMNPYSLSVIWWRIEGWTFLYALAPFFVALMLEVAFLPHPKVRNLVGVVALGIVLSPGIVGAPSIVFGYVVLFASLAIVGRALWNRIGLTSSALRLTAIWAVFFGVELWWLIPYVSIPGYAFSSTSYITYSNLLEQYVNTSAGATLINVLGLRGSSWFLLSDPKSSFPWLELTPLLMALSLALLALSLTSLLERGPRRRIGMVLVLFILVPVVWATGSNPPFSSVKFYLLSQHGPFLALEEGYNLVEALYVIGIVGLVFLAVSAARDWLASSGSDSHPSQPGRNPAGSKTRPDRALVLFPAPHRACRRLFGRQLAAISIVAAAVVIGAGFAYPFVSGHVYKTAGPNSGGVDLPSSFGELSTFFQQNYAGPYYYALLLPLSSSTYLPLTIGRAEVIDTTGLIAQYIPYPLIWINNSALSSALDSVFSLGPALNYTTMLSALHIRYVIFNPYANEADPAVAKAGNGRSMNWSAVNASLRSTFPAVQVGRFTLFENFAAPPLAVASTGISSFVDPSLVDYLTTLSGIDYAPEGPAGQLADAVWAPLPVGGVPSTTAFTPSGPSASYSVPHGENPYLVSAGGQLVTPENASRVGIVGVSYNPFTRLLSATSPPICTLTMGTCRFTSSFAVQGGTYYNPINRTSQLALPSAMSNGTLVYGTFDVEALATKSWLSIVLDNQSAQLLCQIFADPSLGTQVIGLAIENSAGLPYAWNNVELPSSMIPGEINISIYLTLTTVSAAVVSISQPDIAVNDQLYYQPADVARDGGFNSSAVPSSAVTFGNRTVELIATYPEMTISSFGEYQPTHVLQVLETPIMSSPSPLLPASLATTITGNIQMSMPQDLTRTTSYVILAYPVSSLWDASSPGCNLAKVAGFPLANVFAISGCDANGGTLVVTLTFAVGLDTGLFIGITLFIACSTAYIVFQLPRRVRHESRNRR